MDPKLIAELRGMLGETHVLTGQMDTARHTIPFRGRAGRAAAVALPATADEALSVVELAVNNGIRVLPQGANTGLVGASVPDDTGTWLVLCTDRMNSIEFAADGDLVICGAGVRLSTLNDALAPSGRWLPIDIGGDPSIGGMASTNAGGSRMIRYGDTASRVIDVEGIVTAPGPLRTTFGPLVHKNSVPRPGRDLLVGGNGQFGLITAVALATAPLRAVVQLGWAVVGSAAEAQDIVSALLDSGLQLDAAEVMADACLDAVKRAQPTMRLPRERGAYHLLIEVSLGAGSVPATDPASAPSRLGRAGRPTSADSGAELLASTLETVVSTAVPAAQLLSIEPASAWAIRHAISAALRLDGSVIGCDIGLPRHRLAGFVDEVRAWLASSAPEAVLCDFGHWADGGVHANLVIPQTGEAAGTVDTPALRSAVNERAVAHGGTFSAEHGLGPHNAAAWRRYSGAGQRAIFGQLKAAFDPFGLWGWPLNTGD